MCDHKRCRENGAPKNSEIASLCVYNLCISAGSQKHQELYAKAKLEARHQ